MSESESDLFHHRALPSIPHAQFVEEPAINLYLSLYIYHIIRDIITIEKTFIVLVLQLIHT